MIELTQEGKDSAEKGTIEFHIVSSLEMNKPVLKSVLEQKFGEAQVKIGLGKA
jgi:hypothetical protein